MARDVPVPGAVAAIDPAELVARLDAHAWSLDDEDSLHDVAQSLAALAANRDFLADRAIEELQQACAGQAAINRYNAQVLIVHRVPGRYFIRANFWPAADDPVLRASGDDHYFYHRPHDHNFDFLTVGYWGPGYRSRWYDYDAATIDGVPGERVDLRLVEEGCLSPGRILHYRAHRDVHDQLPPTAMSVSINIVPEHEQVVWRDQYFFDLDRQMITGIPTLAPSEVLLRIATTMRPGEGLMLAEDFARRHPSHRMRWSAWRALIGASTSVGDRDRLIEAAARSSSPMVARSAQRLIMDSAAS